MSSLRFRRGFAGLVPLTIAVLASCSGGPESGPSDPAGVSAAKARPPQDVVLLGMTVADMASVSGTDLTAKHGGGFTVGLLSQPFSISLRVVP